ncbi:putative nucleotidyltransferase substrate binding domain-containing protein [Megalodesulfovibrio paquesii]
MHDAHTSEMILEFLRQTLPFSELPEAALRELTKAMVVDFAPKGTVLLQQGVTSITHLMLVQKGGVRVFLRDAEGEEHLLDWLGEGASVGGLTIFQGGLARTNAVTVEDTFLLLLPLEAFLAQVEQHPLLATHYLQRLSDEFLGKAFESLRHRGGGLECGSQGGGPYLFGSTVGDFMHGPPVCVGLSASIRQAALRMMEQRVGSALVEDPSGEAVGIVTDSDLRRTVAFGMDAEAPVAVIMSSPVERVDWRESVFAALMTMMRRQIHHLAVTRDGRVLGMITSHDIMVLQGKSPMALFREILAQQTPEGLHPLGQRIPLVARTLVEEGAKAGHITSLLSVLNDALAQRLLHLLSRQLGPAPAAWGWLYLGSEGRREQTLRTDQDNALVHADIGDEIIARAAAIYFEALAERMRDHLAACGYPPCPGGVMAANPAWRLSLTRWKAVFDQWIDRPGPQEIMQAAIFFDLRPGSGEETLGEALRTHLVERCPRQDVFLRHLAANCLQARPPLSFFRGFLVEKDGARKNTLDIKAKGIMPMVDFARVLALRAGLRETNTFARLRLLTEQEVLPADLGREALEAYEFMMQVRLVHQLEQQESGHTPDNHIAPDSLSALEQRTLKQSFQIVSQAQAHVKEEFQLHIA